jgi:nucleoid-associated protein EbfC
MSDVPVDPTDPDDELALDGGEANPFAGGFDMGSLLEQAMEMQQHLLDAQASAAEAVVEGHAGGGVVKIRVSGAMVFESVVISPEVVDPDDVELLADLILAALNDAVDQIGNLQQASMGGLDLGGLGGALGLGASPSLGLGPGADDEDEDEDEDEEEDDEGGPGGAAR